jgi:hypothetical protein
MKKQMGSLKKMTLNRETLRGLQAGEMQNVNGGLTQSACASLCSICISCHGGPNCN